MTCPCAKSHDITFCEGLYCGKTITCHRFIGNHTWQEDEMASVCQFGNREGECKHYWVKDVLPEV